MKRLVWTAVSLQTSFLTPPVGFALFYLKGICPEDVLLIDIYKGVIPFIILQLIGLLIVAAYPQLVIWLPADFVFSGGLLHRQHLLLPLRNAAAQVQTGDNIGVQIFNRVA